jgi:hypothetical protein
MCAVTTVWFQSKGWLALCPASTGARRPSDKTVVRISFCEGDWRVPVVTPGEQLMFGPGDCKSGIVASTAELSMALWASAIIILGQARNDNLTNLTTII